MQGTSNEYRLAINDLQERLRRSTFDDDGSDLNPELSVQAIPALMHLFLDRIDGEALRTIPRGSLVILQDDLTREATRDSFLSSPTHTVAGIVYASFSTLLMQVLGSTVLLPTSAPDSTPFGAFGRVFIAPSPDSLMVASAGILPHLMLFTDRMASDSYKEAARRAMADIFGDQPVLPLHTTEPSDIGRTICNGLGPVLAQFAQMSGSQVPAVKGAGGSISRLAWNEKLTLTAGRATDPNLLFSLCYHTTLASVPTALESETSEDAEPDPFSPTSWMARATVASLDLATASKRIRFALDGPANSTAARSKATDAQLAQLFLVQDFSHPDTGSLVDLTRTGEDPLSSEAVQITLETYANALKTIGFLDMANGVLKLRTDLRFLVGRFLSLRPVANQFQLANAVLSTPLYEGAAHFPIASWTTLDDVFQRMLSLETGNEHVQLILFNAQAQAASDSTKRPHSGGTDSHTSGGNKRAKPGATRPSTKSGKTGSAPATKSGSGKTAPLDSDSWAAKRQAHEDARPACLPAGYTLCRDWVRSVKGCTDPKSKCTAIGGPYLHAFPANISSTDVTTIREWVADLYKK